MRGPIALQDHRRQFHHDEKQKRIVAHLSSNRQPREPPLDLTPTRHNPLIPHPPLPKPLWLMQPHHHILPRSISTRESRPIHRHERPRRLVRLRIADEPKLFRDARLVVSHHAR